MQEPDPPGPRRERLSLYGSAASAQPLDWDQVDRQLCDAGSYWVQAATATAADHPHPRPVWGLWVDHRLHLSVGSPGLARALVAGAAVTVNLTNDTDVVIVEGVVVGPATDDDLLAAYNNKYDWDYTIEGYGPLTTVGPTKIMAWHSSGWAGRGGFQQAGRWRF